MVQSKEIMTNTVRSLSCENIYPVHVIFYDLFYDLKSIRSVEKMYREEGTLTEEDR